MVVEKIKFHLDESVSNAIADGLRRRKIDVTTSHVSHAFDRELVLQINCL